jgi:hypothetical protein
MTLLFPFLLSQMPCPTTFKRKSKSTVLLKAIRVLSIFQIEIIYS